MRNPEQKLIDILNKYLPPEGEMPSGGDVLKNMYQNLQNPEMIIPVLGLQGVGKSTLLNGILKENIMPNEADETTCIPVEVRYGSSSAAVVYFHDGKTAQIKKSDLAQYVDNNFNPGNQKQVSHIVIEKDMDLLKNGIVLVDLPGVGSLTSANSETTKSYIKKLYAAIFVIRVNPPITRTEASFIRIAWNTLSNAWFVQNRWNNENEREIKEGLEANTTILKDIASKTQIPYSGEIITVNAYGALKGVLQNDDASIADSAINVITEKLLAINGNWREEAEKFGIEKIKGLFSLANGVINDKIENYKLSKADLEKKIKQKENEFKKNSINIDKQISEIEEIIDEQRVKGSSFITGLVRKAEENIRANIYQIVDGGVTDGEDLTQAFKDYQMQEFEIVNEEYNYFIKDLVFKISGNMAELNDIFENEQKQSFSASSFSKRQEFKWEKGMDAAVRVGSGVGGILAGAAVGTAIGGPIGTVAGLVAGLLINIVGSFIGSGSRKLVMQQRASETKKQIAPYIDETCENIRKGLKKTFEEICDGIIEKLRSLRSDRLSQARKDSDDAISILNNDNDVEEKLRELGMDLEFLVKEEGLYHVI